jgi:hypothetical protein
MDVDTIAELVRRKVFYVPTIDHNQYYVENADTVYHFPPGAKERLLDYIARNFATAKKAFEAGARMVVGSDAVYNGWGLNMRELDWFVKMGMTPAQALKAATTEPAVADEHDTLEPEALFEITQHVGHCLGVASVAREHVMRNRPAVDQNQADQNLRIARLAVPAVAIGADDSGARETRSSSIFCTRDEIIAIAVDQPARRDSRTAL